MKKEYKDRLRKYQLAKEEFWMKIYPAMSFSQKIDYWAASIHRQMRYNGESGLDPYAVFSPEDYQAWKSTEPLIGAMMGQIVERLNLDKKKIEMLTHQCF
jgi:hypothetical protein